MFERTTEGFAKAVADAQWMANFHKQEYAVFVSCHSADRYSVTRLEWMDPNEFADGTSFYSVTPDHTPKTQD